MTDPSPDPLDVSTQYATTDRLSTRAAVWRPTADGRTPQEVALDALVAENPRRYVDLGCGPGVFASRLQEAIPGCQVLALDQSAAMVAEACERGIDARVGDVAHLPWEDASFDVVSAMWMLYHVPDIDQALCEIRRVLKPGGLALVTTNSAEHLADLRAEAHLEPIELRFRVENAEEYLRRHFDHVECQVLRTTAVFDGSAGVARYLATVGESADGLEPFTGERTYAGVCGIYLCR